MSMNRYMHPRNIYKVPPNFKQLAIEYPEFRKHAKQDVGGKVTIDFKDVFALRALTCVLLKKDFGLDVELPSNKLIPTVPLRLNYLLWIEDLLSISGGIDCVKGIDIGTGASCIYPLLAAKLHGWNMLATEIDKDSIKFARENVARNSLQTLITVKHIEDESLLLEALGDSIEQYDFCMCNPPFFSNPQELHFSFKSRKESRPRPNNAFCASIGEVVSKGGEVEFVTKLIQESKKLNNRVRIYSTMIGHKTSLMPLKKLLRETNVVSFKQTEFCQGHTTRWGLAWTFCDIDLRKVPEITLAASRKQKLKVPLKHIITTQDQQTLAVEEVAKKLENIFNDIMIRLENIKHSKNVVAYNFIATRNSWSHQRRKRRARQQMSKVINNTSSNGDVTSADTSLPSSSNTSENSISMDVDQESCANGSVMEAESNINCVCGNKSDNSQPELSISDTESTADRLAEIDVNSSPGSVKRELEDDDADDYYQAKRSRKDVGECKCHQNEFYVKCLLVVKRENQSQVSVELSLLQGTENKEILHQILQYIKNNV